MTVQITIVGLGQIGASFGLALAEKKDLVRRVGHDKDLKTAQKAEKIGAVDRIEINLPRAVRDADLVLVCLPLHEIRKTLEIIAPELKAGAVVMETGMAKRAAASWAEELFPEGRYYIGVTPIINPAYLHEMETGIDGSHADLFQKGLMGIVTLSQADPGAVQLAADLAKIIGTDPLFSDLLEIDGLMSAAHLLPQILAATLVNALIDQPGWREVRKLTGRAYTGATEPVLEASEASALALAAILNRENLLRLLDNLTASIEDMKNVIRAGDEASITSRLERARQARLKWWADRKTGDWSREELHDIELPENPGILGRLLGSGVRPKRPR